MSLELTSTHRHKQQPNNNNMVTARWRRPDLLCGRQRILTKPYRVAVMGALVGLGFLASSFRLNSNSTRAPVIIVDPFHNFQTSATRCHPSVFEHENEDLYKSQHEEDKRLMKEIFTGLCNGSYLEIGGFDGVIFSNTYALHKSRRWKGILIESAPNNYKKLKKNRPKDTTIHAAVCDKEQTLHYVGKGGTVSGIWEFMAPTFREHWWKDVDINDKKLVTPIHCLPLTKILTDIHVQFVDVFSLDVEGAELKVLQSLDFNRFAFGSIFVEADDNNLQKNEAVRDLLQSHGYVFTDSRSGSDWFVHPNLDEIYKSNSK